MSKRRDKTIEATDEAPATAPARVALLSNPTSAGKLAKLGRIRAYCADHPDIFHYEVDRVDQIGEALRTIARVRPKMLVVNGGDGTIQAVLTELHNTSHFSGEPPPVAVLPGGKTNLIALNLGVHGSPLATLKRLVDLARGDLSGHVVARELIALREDGSDRPVIGMFLGGSGLAGSMLYCRNRIYPLGLPNGISHVLTALAVLVGLISGLRTKFLPPKAEALRISTGRDRPLSGRYTLLAVTTLDRLLLSSELRTRGRGPLKLVAVEERPASVVRAVLAGIAGKLGREPVRGVYLEEADEISIEGECSSLILDGQTFRAEAGRPIRLRPAPPLSFVRIAA